VRGASFGPCSLYCRLENFRNATRLIWRKNACIRALPREKTSTAFFNQSFPRGGLQSPSSTFPKGLPMNKLLAVLISAVFATSAMAAAHTAAPGASATVTTTDKADVKADKKMDKADAKADKKAAKAEAKAAKAKAKAEKKKAKADAKAAKQSADVKADKVSATAEAKADKAEAKADKAK
jgi:hypothetical protein